MADYSQDSIQVLEGLEPVRRRPGMYIGSTDGEGLFHMLFELVGNSIDQHLGGHATELRVAISSDGWILVSDDGPGIPTIAMPERADRRRVSFLEHVFTRLHCGATFDGHFPHIHLTPGLHGVGVAVVSALSERVEVETTYEGVRWQQVFERGERATPLQRLGPTAVEGTAIRFRPDPMVFGAAQLERTAVEARLRELAWLNPRLRMFWQERRLGARGGIATWASRLAAERGDVVCRYATTNRVRDVHVEVAFAWNACGEPIVRSYVNMQPTCRDGTHVDGIWSGFAEHARTRKTIARRVRHVREAIGCGLVAIVHVGLYHARFGSPSQDQLKNPEAAGAVCAAVRASLADGAWHGWHVRRFLDERLRVEPETAG